MSGAIRRNDQANAEAQKLADRAAHLSAQRKGTGAPDAPRNAGFAPLLGELLSASNLQVDAVERVQVAPEPKAEREDKTEKREEGPAKAETHVKEETSPTDRPVVKLEEPTEFPSDEEAIDPNDGTDIPSANLLANVQQAPVETKQVKLEDDQSADGEEPSQLFEDTDLAEDEGLPQEDLEYQDAMPSEDGETEVSLDGESVAKTEPTDAKDYLAERLGRQQMVKNAAQQQSASTEATLQQNSATKIEDAGHVDDTANPMQDAEGSPDAAKNPLFDDLRNAGRNRIDHLEESVQENAEADAQLELNTDDAQLEADAPLDVDAQSADIDSIDPIKQTPTLTGQALAASSAAATGAVITSGTSTTVGNAGNQASVAQVAPAAESANNAGNQNSGQNGDLNNQQQENTANAARAQRSGRASRTMQQRSIEVVQQVAKAIGLRAASSSTGNVTLLLRPEALGSLRLDLSYGEDGKLSITGSAESELARQMLGTNVEQLRQALRQENIELARFQLEQQFSQARQNDTSSSGQGQSSRDGSSRSGGRGNQANVGNAGDLGQNNTTNDEQRIGRIGPGAVNIRA